MIHDKYNFLKRIAPSSTTMKDGPETPTDDVESPGLLNHQEGGGISTILMVMSGHETS
jgi:hypothetical protein